MKQKLQQKHQLMREFMEFQKERQKTYYESSNKVLNYNIGENVLVSTDSESNINPEDQTEAENVINPLHNTKDASENSARTSVPKPLSDKLSQGKSRVTRFC